jgi:hypothetical protein
MADAIFLWAEDIPVRLANMLHHVVGIIIYRAIAT